MFIVDLETMLPYRANFTANHTLNSCSKVKEIMMRGLDVSSTRHNGTEADKGAVGRTTLYNNSDDKKNQ